MVCEIFSEERDINVKFMAPHSPSSYFYWPMNNFCFVTSGRILCVVSPPTPATISGHSYQIEKHDLQKFQQSFSEQA